MLAFEAYSDMQASVIITSDLELASHKSMAMVSGHSRMELEVVEDFHWVKLEYNYLGIHMHYLQFPEIFISSCFLSAGWHRHNSLWFWKAVPTSTRKNGEGPSLAFVLVFFLQRSYTLFAVIKLNKRWRAKAHHEIVLQHFLSMSSVLF